MPTIGYNLFNEMYSRKDDTKPYKENIENVLHA